MAHAFDDMLIARSLAQQEATKAAKESAGPMDTYLHRVCGTRLPPAPKGFQVKTAMERFFERKGWE